MEMDLHTGIKLVHSIAPAAIVADTNGAAIDTKDFESVEFAFHVGTAMVGGGFSVKLQDSDTGAFGGEQADVTAVDLLGATVDVAIGDANKVFRIGYIGKKRYVRPVLTETGTITGGVIGCMAILGHPKVGPVPDQNT